MQKQTRMRKAIVQQQSGGLIDIQREGLLKRLLVMRCEMDTSSLSHAGAAEV